MSLFDAHGRRLELDRPRIMGVLNVTPDSFSDGGRFTTLETALAQAERLIEEGADLVDVGGESTRPGAAPVDPEEERARVLPLIRALRASHADLWISIDTRRASVAAAALEAGANLVNDVSGLEDPDMAATCADHGAPVVLGHIQGTPQTMQRDPSYGDVVDEVAGFLSERRERLVAAGLAPERILVDPGIGFGKTQEHNLALLAHLERLVPLGPVVVGISRKSLLGALTGRPTSERLAAGLGAAAAAVLNGARIVRTHDVAETHDALTLAWAIHSARSLEVTHAG